MSKDIKKKISIDIKKRKKQNCKDMEDCSMVENENENEEMGQHVLLAQVF